MLSGARLRRIAGLVCKERRCPMCGWRGFRFEPFGNRVLWRPDALCPGCGALERHRAVFLFLKDKIPRGQRVLHVAPEALMISWLVQVSTEYLNVDLYNPAMRKMDLTAIDLPDGDRTLVWCSHVLEHIPDDRKAMSEIYRVLAPGGMLIAQVPIGGPTTFEDDTIVSEDDRLEMFLQEDHVRLYGLDIVERFKSVGFECEVLSTADLPPADQVLYGFGSPVFREVFVCKKPG